MGILGLINVCFEVYEWPCSMCIQSLLLTLNGLHIMVTLGIYFEYIKIISQIFSKYIVAILQICQIYFIIYPKIITNDIYCYIFIILFIFIHYLIIKKLIFNIIFD